MKYRLPDGGRTDDPIKYCDAYHKISDPICKEFNMLLYSFDPVFRFMPSCINTPDNNNWEEEGIITMPAFFAIQLRDLIERK